MPSHLIFAVLHREQAATGRETFSTGVSSGIRSVTSKSSTDNMVSGSHVSKLTEQQGGRGGRDDDNGKKDGGMPETYRLSPQLSAPQVHEPATCRATGQASGNGDSKASALDDGAGGCWGGMVVARTCGLARRTVVSSASALWEGGRDIGPKEWLRMGACAASVQQANVT